MITVPPSALPDLLRAADWRTSTRSQTSNCVEIAPLTTRTTGNSVAAVAVRDSKDRRGPVLVFARSQWQAFLAGAKDGEFDLR
jgi:hypothetical protein